MNNDPQNPRPADAPDTSDSKTGTQDPGSGGGTSKPDSSGGSDSGSGGPSGSGSPGSSSPSKA